MNCVKQFKAHEGPINCFERIDFESQGTFVTGGDDGFMRIWDAQYNLVFEINAKDFQSTLCQKLQSAITSMSWEEDYVVFGTRSGEIYYGKVKRVNNGEKEILDIEKDKRLKLELRTLVTGHSDSTVTGIAVSYVSPEFYTIGTNNILMKWNYEKHQLKQHKKLDFPAKLLEISVNNNFLVVGCFNGTILVINPITFNTIYCHNMEKKEVSALSFSPSNENLAIGYVNGVVSVLSSPMKFKLSMEVRNPNINPITALDFSEDNCYLRANFSNLRTCVYDLGKKAPLKDLKRVKDERWSQWRTLLGWEVQGIWSEYDDPSQIAGICRNEEKDILLIWDVFGGVKAYRYPCVNYQSPFLRIAMNHTALTSACFNYSNTKLFLLGKNDSSIVQYSVKYDSASNQEKRNRYEENLGPLLRKPGAIQSGLTSTSRVKSYLAEMPKLWPSKIDPAWLSRDVNYINMEVRNAAGINKADFKNCIVAAKDDCLVYFCGTCFVQHNLHRDKGSESRMYSYFHSKRISAMDLGTLGKYIATGESLDDPNEQASIVIHEFEKNEIISTMELPKGENCKFLKFTPSRNMLVSLSENKGCYRICLLDWINSLVIQSLIIGHAVINDVSFKDDSELATVGDNHITFWTIDGSRLLPESGAYGSNEVQEITSCSYAFEKKILFTGTVTGYISYWNSERACVRPFSAHEGKVLLMRSHRKDTLFTAGSEGVVYRWGLVDHLEKQAEVYALKDIYQKQAKYLSINPALSSIMLISEYGDAIRTGTKDKPAIVFQEIASPITCVYYSEIENQIILATEDSRLLKMKMFGCRIENEDQAKELVHRDIYICAIISYFAEKKFIVGDSKGVIRVLEKRLTFSDSQESSVTTTFTQASNRISIMKLSPDEKILAVSSNMPGNKLEIFEITNSKLERRNFLSPNFHGYIIAFDWNVEGTHILANSSMGEMSLLSIKEQKVIKIEEGRDFKWFTYTTIFNFFSSGLHSKADGSTDISAVATKENLSYIVAGTKKGEVSC